MVRLQRRPDPEGVIARCSELGQSLLEEIREAAAPWRDDGHVAERLRELARVNDLPGLSLAWEDPPKLELPPSSPIHVSFEPLPLDEYVARLARFRPSEPPLRRSVRLAAR